MLSTITLAASLLLLLIAGIAAWSLCLRWGLWWAGAPRVTMRRVVVAAVLVYLVQLPIGSLFALLPESSCDHAGQHRCNGLWRRSFSGWQVPGSAALGRGYLSTPRQSASPVRQAPRGIARRDDRDPRRRPVGEWR